MPTSHLHLESLGGLRVEVPVQKRVCRRQGRRTHAAVSGTHDDGGGGRVVILAIVPRGQSCPLCVERIVQDALLGHRPEVVLGWLGRQHKVTHQPSVLALCVVEPFLGGWEGVEVATDGGTSARGGLVAGGVDGGRVPAAPVVHHERGVQGYARRPAVEAVHAVDRLHRLVGDIVPGIDMLDWLHVRERVLFCRVVGCWSITATIAIGSGSSR